MKELVMIWGKPYEVSVYQKSKTVWVASGDYMGKSIQTQGQSRTSAAARWREAAQYRGNDGPSPGEVPVES